jgi:phage tail sheath protein FI
MNYTYTASATNEDIRNQFINAISYQYSAMNYPRTHSAFWEAFADHYVYDFDVIVSSGFTGLPDVITTETMPITIRQQATLHLNMLRLAVSRGDAVALLDTPQNWTYVNVYEYTDIIGGPESIYSFGAVHAPWCKMRDLSTGNYAMMPASLAFLGAVAAGLVSNGETSLWYAPAGVARASCNNVVGAQYEIGGTILNYWQNDNVARVNPVMRVLNYGYCVYGNATLMQNMKGYTKSSLQSLGTRFLCNAIKKAIFSLCVRLTFEPNDYNLWSTFRTELGDVLRQYQLNGVISQYEIVMDDSTVTDEDKQNLTVPGKVNIVPTLPAEYFDIDFTISAQGVTFAEQVIEEGE